MLLRWNQSSPATLILTVRDHHMHTISLRRTKFHLILDTSAGAQWGPGDHWGLGNYASYHPQEHGETSSGIQRGHMSFSARGFHDSYHGPFPFHAPQDQYQQPPQHHYQPPARRCTIIIHHQRAMMSPTSSRKWMTVSHLLRRGSRRSEHSTPTSGMTATDDPED
jgi:hypothetical protein